MVFNAQRAAQRQAAGDGQPFPFPVPTSGLNLRDDITALRPDEARELKNWVPDTGVISKRNGSTEQSTGAGTGVVTTLSVFEGATERQLIAAAEGELYDVSSSTASVITVSAAYANDEWVTENKNGFLFGVNGIDTPWRYNGTTVSATGFTGPTLTDLTTVANVRDRLWFTVLNSADVEYGTIGGVTGVLTTFQLSQISSGGWCQAIGSWSRDDGAGADDVTVFVMNTGEVIVYSGDPGATFTLIGKFRTDEPIGRRCLFKLGGDLILITRNGFVPISSIVSGALRQDLTEIPVWGRVAPGVAQDAVDFGANEVWSGMFESGLVVVNIPVLGGSISKQYVLNTRNNAWTIFDLEATDFASFNGDLYFGGFTGGKVWKYSGGSDNGSEIELVSRSGFVSSPNANNARTTQIRPFIVADGDVRGLIDVDLDYVETAFSGAFKDFIPADSGMDWGDDWGGDWAGGDKVFNRWFGIKGEGNSVAIISKMESKASNVRWQQTQVRAKPQGSR